jgi:hypothetical protein
MKVKTGSDVAKVPAFSTEGHTSADSENFAASILTVIKRRGDLAAETEHLNGGG